MNDLSPEARALIAQALADDAGPSVDQQARVHRAVSRGAALAASIALTPAAAAGGASAAAGAGSAAAAGAASGSGVLASIGLAKVVSWVGVGFVGGALALGTTTVVQRADPAGPANPADPAGPRGRASLRVAAPAPSSTPFPEPPSFSDEASDPKPEAGRPRLSQAATTSSGKSTALAPRPSAAPLLGSPDARLERELALMVRVQDRLKAGDAPSALALLSEHRAQFGTGPLADEMLAAEVLARCQMGDVEQAARLGAVFLARAPGSPLAARVRNSCAGMGR
jgi:hypothetical protein